MTTLQKQQRLSSTATISPFTFDTSNADLANYISQIMQLLILGQKMCGQTQGVTDCICKEVVRITEGRAQLFLHYLSFSARAEVLSPTMLISLPVQFGRLNYGVLYIASDPEQPFIPALPLSIAHLIAQVCSWLLYTFEQSAFVQLRCKQLGNQAYIHLTKREREVLVLLAYGYHRKVIAEELSIATTTVAKHQQHIYEQLGVHSERDALLAAYCAGLFSPIEEIRR